MEEVQAAGELVPEGIYHVRVSSVSEEMSKQNKPMVVVDFKIQSEGISYGRNVRVWASLEKNALFTLKSMYKAAGYNPGPEGHDPESLLDAEMYLQVTHGMYNGAPSMNVPPYSFKPLTSGGR
jgi:hypothetical protein